MIQHVGNSVVLSRNPLIRSVEVVSAVLEVANRLNMSSKTEVSGRLNDRAVNKPLVSGIVNLGERIVVATRDGESGDKPNSSEAEEVSHIHEADCVEG